MSIFMSELEDTRKLLTQPVISRDLARAYERSLPWIREHAAALEGAGWTVERLYRVGALPFPYSDWGPGWLTLWNNEKCEPRLDARGNIEFVLKEAGGKVVQTCWAVEHFLG